MNDVTGLLSRRRMMQASGLGLLGASIAMPAFAQGADRAAPIDRGGVKNGAVSFDPISDPDTEAPQKPDPAPLPPEQRVGIAIVGLGRLTLEEILPAFAESKKVRLAALVSGSPDKMKALGVAHGIAPGSLYSYEQFDRIADNPNVHAVYIVLPNSLHHEYVIRAAKAGKHVLCEKPMATSSAEAREMIAACAEAKVHLMIAYRCQYEKANRRLVALTRSGELGPLKLVEAVNAQNQGNPDQWRLRKAMSGGGALPDIGLYCLNTIRALTGEEPTEIEARLWSTPRDKRFREVEEAVTWLMRFPSGVQATCATHYGVHKAQTLIAHTPRASLLLENAFAYRGQKLRLSSLEDGTEVDRALQIKAVNQFALELDHMAECILTNRKPRTPGEEGLQDHVLMEAIYAAAEKRTSIALPAARGLDAFRGPALDAG